MSFIVAANWKMNKNPKETQAFFAEFSSSQLPENTEVIFFVPAVNAFAASQYNQSWGPQNFFPAANGAFTGETSPQVMAEMGAEYALVGHSERRQLFNETDEKTNFKIHSAQEFGLSPILCVGESLQERKEGLTLEVVQRQLVSGLSNINISKELHIAYEPVWAIGTGEVATTEQVAEVHQFIGKFLKEKFPSQWQSIKVLYGGSVKPNNAKALSQVDGVGGFLVGGASLQPSTFLEVIKACHR